MVLATEPSAGKPVCLQSKSPVKLRYRRLR